MSNPPLLIDATMLYRWKDLAPVGIVRLERVLAGHLRFRSNLGQATYVIWDRGYRPADDSEIEVLDRLLSGQAPAAPTTRRADIATPTAAPSKGIVASVRRQGLKAVSRLPDNLRPFAEQAAWSAATFAVETGRHVRRTRERKRSPESHRRSARSGVVRHQVDFTSGGDLVALGLGWEYLDHEAMYRLRIDHGVRIHMPAFDLIPVLMPQMNAGQSHLVHRYYAEMAHYADSITSISEATTGALREFYIGESLPLPYLATNPLPGFDAPGEADSTEGSRHHRRHRLEGDEFVLSVSTVEIRKNHLLLAKVWTECVREGHDLPKLAIVGRIGWDVVELQRWVDHAPEIDGRVQIFSDVEDDELHHLYRDALFTVFPSRIEGWGLPITESLTYGKACIHSTDPAQVEASQNLMPALHPDDFLGWKQEILRVANDADYRHELERSIADNYVARTPDEYCERFEAILTERRGLA